MKQMLEVYGWSPERVIPNSTNVVHLCRMLRALVPKGKGIFGFIIGTSK